jgi:hypothetical protein
MKALLTGGLFVLSDLLLVVDGPCPLSTVHSKTFLIICSLFSVR